MMHKKLFAALGLCLAAASFLQTRAAGVQAVAQAELSKLSLGLESFRALGGEKDKASHGPLHPHNHPKPPPSDNDHAKHHHPEYHHGRRQLGGKEEKYVHGPPPPPFKSPHGHPELDKKHQSHSHRYLGDIESYGYGDYGSYGYGYGDHGDYGNYGYKGYDDCEYGYGDRYGYGGYGGHGVHGGYGRGYPSDDYSNDYYLSNAYGGYGYEDASSSVTEAASAPDVSTEEKDGAGDSTAWDLEQTPATDDESTGEVGNSEIAAPAEDLSTAQPDVGSETAAWALDPTPTST